MEYEKQQIFCSWAKKGVKNWSQKPSRTIFQPFLMQFTVQGLSNVFGCRKEYNWICYKIFQKQRPH